MYEAIICPICENVCSSLAVSCPKCGHPITLKNKSENTGKNSSPILVKLFNILAVISLLWTGLLIFLLLASLLFYSLEGHSDRWLSEKWHLIIYLIIGLISYAFFSFLRMTESKKS
jgi:hypothetical protein